MENTLFNPQMMDKFAQDKDLNLNFAKKELITKHINKLKREELKSEKQNYFYFSDVILKEILGYKEECIRPEKPVKVGGKASDFVLHLDNGNEFMIVELKGQKADLDIRQKSHNNQTPVEQAYGYLPKRDAKWAMVSNYDEFRLYHQDRNENEFISFKSEELPKKLHYFMLAFSKKSHVDKDYPQKLLEDKFVADKKLEKNFYNLFHETRLMLIKELEYGGCDREKSIEYAQTILNRYIFICFAEDTKGLLPSKISKKTILNPLEEGIIGKNKIWKRLSELFSDINTGERESISKFNGRFFEEDLSSLPIRDLVEDPKFFEKTKQEHDFKEDFKDIKTTIKGYKEDLNPIYKNLILISSFDFKSQLDVNILGHIFENSIGDIEDLKEGSRGRRKKDGIFYTPSYITEYICKNTIIPYLSKSGKTKEVNELIFEYRGSDISELDAKVRKIKILDPACGSGAFLNKAADILVEIQEAIHDEMYKNDPSLDKFIDNKKERRRILKDNIFGVDLNDESVEITKLGMFLKIAQKKSQLPDLNNNIKCGNSIIDDTKISEKAFTWKDNFKEIFKEGKFDIIVGNPPYISTKQIKEGERDYFWDKYREYLFSEMDTYELFTIISIKYLLKDNGLLGFIIPNSFYTASSFVYMRKLLLQQSINNIIDFPYRFFPFEDTNKETAIIILEKSSPKDNSIRISSINKDVILKENTLNLKNHELNIVEQSKFNLNKDKYKLFITATPLSLKMHVSEFNFGKYAIAHKGWMSVPKKTEVDGTILEKEIFSNADLNSYPSLKKKCESCVEGEDIRRYFKRNTEKYVNTSKMSKRTYSWHKQDKIIMQRITGQSKRRLVSYFDQDQIIAMPNTNLINLKEDVNVSLFTLLGILNSKAMDYYYKKMYGESNTNIPTEVIESFPLPALNTQNKSLFNDIEKKAEELSLKLDSFDHSMFNIIQILKSSLEVDKISNNLKQFFIKSQEEIMEELKKHKKISLKKQKEILEFLDGEKDSLKSQNDFIMDAFSEIDEMVYDLYDLTPKERRIVEESLKY
ncbi:Eco57I restriction-modification methylase domain-containing protein [Methanobacterium aggregans]|uniref:Eco57I restriction-modification methylase domain-containing protein n=1 Tax=Methanobacterium aggregans TaxID=1615586 RepID=UPI001AE5641F|nr:DNA methyltransferase [Methanobacterium aggregans]MBP2045183.1 type I restriction-modification system DNA methylase subunit [Methanobacterium aggregans]